MYIVLYNMLCSELHASVSMPHTNFICISGSSDGGFGSGNYGQSSYAPLMDFGRGGSSRMETSSRKSYSVFPPPPPPLPPLFITVTLLEMDYRPQCNDQRVLVSCYFSGFSSSKSTNNFPNALYFKSLSNHPMH